MKTSQSANDVFNSNANDYARPPSRNPASEKGGVVDVYNDSDVMWALASRVQADDGTGIIHNAMGAILDASG